MDVKLKRLEKAPVIEALFDFDCDMPTKFSVEGHEDAFKASYVADYPEVRVRFSETHQIQSGKDGEASRNTQRTVDGYQFWNTEKNVLVQTRQQGFSFNKLRPYNTLDDYLSVIRLNWEKFVEIGQPIQLKTIRMRFINRIELPLTAGTLELKDYLRICPELPDDSDLAFTSFYHQHEAVEKETGNVVSIVLATQAAAENHLPLIFDITVSSTKVTEPDDWRGIEQQIATLRLLKNRMFANTLTPTCLSLYQQP